MKQKEIKYEIDNNDCWICISHWKDKYVYPEVRRNGKKGRMHRYIYTQYKGEIPNNLCVRHMCDNPECINPDHLILGTHQDNMNDKVERNRQVIGEQHKNSKLTNEIVLQIKQRSLTEKSNRILAKEFNISYSNIEKIKAGTRWKHVKI